MPPEVKPETGSDPEIIEALKRVTGAREVRRLVAADESDNFRPRYEPGYSVLRHAEPALPGQPGAVTKLYTFDDEGPITKENYEGVGRTHHVPAHRLDEFLKPKGSK